MPRPTDLKIYRDCVRAMLNDPKALYTASSVNGLGFTYPPFAAIALTPLALIPSLPVTILHYGVSAIALAIMIDLIWRRCGHKPQPLLTAIFVAVLNFSEPIGKTFVYGQV
ncbi:MAG: glycosyltransferase family 87 protein, partial [Cutibacterium acnes]|nr:glycosyltransferase family 87 protein [Cutibacterium acnes]